MPGSSKDSKERVGSRLIELRRLTGMTRKAFAEKYGLSVSTLRSWEKGFQNGLPQKSASIILNAFRKECIECSLDWLIMGEGEPPKQYGAESEHFAQTKESPENAFKTIDIEIEYFKKVHPEAEVFHVKDDSMLPVYRQRDVVAGVKSYSRDIGKLIGAVCIVELEKGGKLLRVLRTSTIPNHFCLYALNENTRVVKPHLYDIRLQSAALVVWLRRGSKLV